MNFKTFLETVNKSDIPAYLRKNDKMTTKDLEKERTQNRSHPETIKKINGTQMEEVEQIDEKSEQAKRNKTMKNMMDASRGARYKVQNKLSGDDVRDWDGKHPTPRAQNVAIGRALRNEDAEQVDEGRMKAIATNAQETDRLKKKDDVPFDGPYTKTPATTTDKSGAVHTAMSRAKHLAKQAMKNVKEEAEVLDELRPLTYMSYHNKATAIGRDGKKAFDKSGKDRSANIAKADKRVIDAVHGRGPLPKLYPTAKKTTLGKKAQAAIRSDAKWNEEVELEEGYDKSSEHHKNARKMAKDYDGKATFHPNGHAEVRMRSIVHGYSTLNPKGTTLMSGEDLANRACKEHGKGKVQGNVVHFKEEKDEQEYGYEGDMALNQLATLTRCAEMIKDTLKPDTDLPEWVQSKITLATDYIQTAADYLYSESEVNEGYYEKPASAYRRKGDEVRDPTPVAPVPAKKYIKGTPENKAARAASKPINGMPTNVKSEELKGNQHRIDKNKNGKIDAHDFKLLRKEEQSKEQFENGELETMSKSYKQFVESLNEIKMSDLPSRKISGSSYGAQYHDSEGDDEEEKPKAKPAADAVKRGRGRPAGAKSGARQSGSAVKSKNGADYTGYKLHLPNKN